MPDEISKTKGHQRFLSRLEELYKVNYSLTQKYAELQAQQEKLEIKLTLNKFQISILEFIQELGITLDAVLCSKSEEELQRIRIMMGGLENKKSRILQIKFNKWTGFRDEKEKIRLLIHEVQDLWLEINQQIEISYQSFLYNTRLDLLKKLQQHNAKMELSKIQELLQYSKEKDLLTFLMTVNIEYNLTDKEISFTRQVKTNNKKILLTELFKYAENFSLKCAGHLQRVSLAEAIKQDWKICATCSMYYCKECYNSFVICPNLGQGSHPLEPTGLPFEEILGFLRTLNQSYNISSSVSANFKPELFVNQKKVDIIK